MSSGFAKATPCSAAIAMERDMLVARLASLLQIGTNQAKGALEVTGWDFERAVKAACEAAAPEAKRRRTEIATPVRGGAAKNEHAKATASNFAIPNNDQDPSAEQPELAHPLRPEQLRSLGWMLAQEGVEDRLKGGLLADRMGYGKTSVAIALISKDLQLTERSLREQAAAEKLLSDSTLIVAPSHLIDQWEQEFEKFLPNRVEYHRSVAVKPKVEELEFTAKACEIMLMAPGDRGMKIGTTTGLPHLGAQVIQSIRADQEKLFQKAGVKLQRGDVLKSIVFSGVTDEHGRPTTVTMPTSQRCEHCLTGARCNGPQLSRSGCLSCFQGPSPRSRWPQKRNHADVLHFEHLLDHLSHSPPTASGTTHTTRTRPRSSETPDIAGVGGCVGAPTPGRNFISGDIIKLCIHKGRRYSLHRRISSPNSMWSWYQPASTRSKSMLAL